MDEFTAIATSVPNRRLPSQAERSSHICSSRCGHLVSRRTEIGMGMEFEPKRNDDQSNWDNTRIGLDGIPGEEGVIYWKKQNGTREIGTVVSIAVAAAAAAVGDDGLL
ncbi:predicted protein [Histoplasma capsulatum var. duboisii H88]|uniref:Predicted protein n=2 Tax=Ajellomyces capsulatus TaxID=5037 RepID=F0UVL3_AJEC8|nr:predicted protein [Histoplasma capsulatum H143]EGC49940.1 predicted protein [Histoplasma capsulatum var. duboisii H88]